MRRQQANPSYFDILVRRTRATWWWAGAGALGLNLVLFAAMPHLLRPLQAERPFDEIVAAVNFIRLKQPETPLKPKPQAPPPAPRPRKSPQPPRRRPFKAQLTLPFAVNPRLPAGPGTLSLPPLKSAGLDTIAMDDVFSPGDLDSPLTVLARMPPVYPLHAKHRGIEGWVRVRFVVDETGRVGDITVLESDPPGIFEQTTKRCVAGWRFQAGTVEGVPVKAWAETTIRFKLE